LLPQELHQRFAAETETVPEPAVEAARAPARPAAEGTETDAGVGEDGALQEEAAEAVGGEVFVFHSAEKVGLNLTFALQNWHLFPPYATESGGGAAFRVKKYPFFIKMSRFLSLLYCFSLQMPVFQYTKSRR
jgi:hypothetical protein